MIEQDGAATGYNCLLVLCSLIYKTVWHYILIVKGMITTEVVPSYMWFGGKRGREQL